MISIETARAWYPRQDPVHDFEHVLRVYRLAERLSEAEGADWEIVQTAVLLHDADGASRDDSPSEVNNSNKRESHQNASAEFARKILTEQGWPEERIQAVTHAIRAHRFRGNRERPETLEARILFDADKLDAIGAIGVARAVAFAARAGQPVYSHPSQKFLQTGLCEPGEPHSAYHEFIFKLRHLQDRLHTPLAKKIAAERHEYMAQFFSRLKQEIDGDR